MEYLQRIDETLAPFGGRFIAHGGTIEHLEGNLPEGAAIILEFPDLASAREWYGSDAYVAIKALRTDNAEGHLFLVDGVSVDHKATDVLGAAS